MEIQTAVQVRLLTIPDALQDRCNQEKHSDDAPDCRWLLEHGRFWTPGTHEDGAPAIAVARQHRLRFRFAHCFNNARRLVLADRSGALTYVEGLATTPMWPGVAEWHAWVVTPEEKVVDPTWFRDRDVPAHMQYFGAAFSRADLHAHSRQIRDGVIARVVGARVGGRLSLMVIENWEDVLREAKAAGICAWPAREGD